MLKSLFFFCYKSLSFKEKNCNNIKKDIYIRHVSSRRFKMRLSYMEFSSKKIRSNGFYGLVKKVRAKKASSSFFFSLRKLKINFRIFIFSPCIRKFFR